MLECVARGQTLGAGGPVVREEGGDAAASPRSNIDMQRSVAVTLVGRQHPEHLCKRKVSHNVCVCVKVLDIKQ